MNRPTSPRWAVSDTLVMAQRDLLAIVRIPTTFVFLLVQPVMFVLLFRYVFGGSIAVRGPYVNYLIPGI
ncbi:MAG: ABC transporter permease, partial [Acidobacteriota bacterium]|nr:ABC transporter permease [Acidobacteriota bacterium]